VNRFIEVSFPKDERTSYYDEGSLSLSKGEWCIVPIERGVDIAKVVEVGIELGEPEDLVSVIRKATPEDWEKVAENQKLEERAYQVCLKKIAKSSLPMKLVDTRYTLDRTKLIFYFTAEGRVDFRKLVRELARTFKCRIEMRQIGVRDEAKLFGGYGVCGRRLCCASFLKSFESVTIKMAKEQSLMLTPEKISGMCGRLMCCLYFEYDLYKEFHMHAPKEGTKVLINGVEGKVVGQNPLQGTISVEVDGRILKLDPEKVERTK
jgi:cell fate regulator YaaT (PSP1 superfamily)